MTGIPSPAQTIQATLKAVDSTLASVGSAAEAVHTSLSPLPSVTSDYNEAVPSSFVTKGIDAFRSQVQRGLPVSPTVVKATFDAIATKLQLTKGLNDRDDALEDILTLLSHSPNGPIINDVEENVVSLLYHDLPHPPSTHVGQKFQFRSADGSGNSLTNPDLGKSFTPYSRSCSTTRSISDDQLPDPGLVFDTLLRRGVNSASSSIYLDVLWLNMNPSTSVIHSVFRTSRNDWNINETSSYVDLGILYGNTQAHQDKIRYKDGRGRLLPDVFAETRLLSLPPGVATLIVCFNRHHNYIADILLSINQRGSWTADLKSLAANKKKLLKQDEEIFQTARLINSAFYANVVLSDYLAGILGTQRDALSWSLDIGSEWREGDRTLLERGRGNSCSVEFNTLYRWHATLSLDDATYIEHAFEGIFNRGQPFDFDTITVDNFERKLTSFLAPKLHDKNGNPIPSPNMDSLTEEELNDLRDDSKPVDYLQLSIPGLRRDPHTKLYSDDDLARILQRATSVPAGAFRARGIPGVLRVIEILGISQSRSWGCCTLNDFRRFLGLRPYTTFEEWNPDRSIADAARKLYRNIENLELYVGLAAGEAKSVKPGSGLCPPYTTARAILADAVALVRGDRYLTYDFTPFNLTTWGFVDANRNTENAAWGGQLGRVLARALPNHYDAESVYTHFPLITPTGQEWSIGNILKNKGYAGQYSLDPPAVQPITKLVVDLSAIQEALHDDREKKFATTYAKNILDIKLSPSFLDVIDDSGVYEHVTKTLQDIYVPKAELGVIGQYFYEKTLQLLREKSFSLNDKVPNFVDVVKDVARLVPVHWASTQIAGLPLKTATEPHGIYYEQQMYQILRDIYSFIFLEADTSLKIPQRREAKQHVESLLPFIKISLSKAKGGLTGSLIGPISNLILGHSSPYLDALLKRLLALQSPIDEVANDILAVISTSSIELSQIFAHVINFYLPPNDPSEWAQGPIKEAHKRATDLYDRLVTVAHSNTHDSTVILEGYVREALRLDPVVEGVYRQTRTEGASQGERLWLDFRAAGLNGDLFERPHDVEPNRPAELYSILHGDGVFKTLGEDFVYRVAGQVLRAVFSRPNLKRATGVAGTLRRFFIPFHPSPDFVEETKKEVEVPIPGGNGKIGYTDTYTYILKPGPGHKAFRHQYQDPENANRLTTWATGLSLIYAAEA
ncbi:hypothetical protein BS47DRAFT_1394408 [Hydnum rufescens UP504]|uniref:Uncharacterized protein n=1 Tax=Hydnum rufescens UP504 TaxID=1448309 RepID=A0A9P6AV30_9AGAM|nr:hypothetical protein BS47DRAFT_1394408 [Hydnum rufescens UP504]